jgi:predicted CXXCH cytochrome family protein
VAKVCEPCHDQIAKPEAKTSVIHPPVKAGQCLVCHTPHASDRAALAVRPPERLCSSCHAKVLADAQLAHGHPPAAQGECARCHDPHQSTRPALLKQKPAELCLSCHTDLAKRIADGSPHAPTGRGLCLACHAPHGSPNAGMVKRQGSALCAPCHDLTKAALVAKHPGMPLQSVNCVSCHDPHAQPKDRHSLIRPVLHLPFGRGDCQQCHTVRGSRQTIAKGSALCFKCHAPIQAMLKQPVVHGAVRGEAECLTCHTPHAANAPKLLRRAQPELCFGCHDRKAFAGAVTHKALDQGCTTCHEPHGSEGRWLLKKAVPVLCLDCHGDMSKHFHPTSSRKPDPRTGGTFNCLSCHRPHASDVEGLLLAEPKRELCILCHDPSLVMPRRVRPPQPDTAKAAAPKKP